MTNSVEEHYAHHLAPIYSWMVGDFDAACLNADAFYDEIGLPAGEGRIAIDLGCGHGVHSIPFALRGYHAVSIDTSEHLLGELRSKAGDLPIRTVNADLMEFTDHLDGATAALIACMGDTLTHLPSVDAVDSIIGDAGRSLAPGGILTLSFRDYVTHELVGAERFIPVRSDDQRLHMCFLEYHAETVLVHDIIHSRVDSSWETKVSAYPKLRLSPDRVITTAESHGLALLHRSVDRGMLHLAWKRQ